MRILPFGDRSAQRATYGDVHAHLQSGGLLLYPTETVFGLGGAATPEATRALAELKGRDAAKPFLLLITNVRQIEGLEWTDAARRLADAFWPGPLTIVLRDADARFPAGVRSEQGGVAVRDTSHEGMRRLIDALNQPLTSTSANRPGARPAETAAEARALFRDLPVRANVWMLDGPAGGTEPSSIVDCTGARPRVVRAGAVPVDQIREIVHDIEV
ncbi:MAG TPA: L-threonylcarbamoyladenylate synthase [Longimicrobiales bacterium]